MLSLEEFDSALENAEVATDEVDVSGLGRIRVREMSGSVRNKLEGALVILRSSGDSKAFDAALHSMLKTCVVNDELKPYLDDGRVRRLMSKMPRAAFQLRDAIVSVSAVSHDDAEKFIEGFDDAQSDGSTSG